MLENFIQNITIWDVAGYIGQMLFFGSWVVQWYVTEKKKRNIIPISFWYMRLAGSVLLLVCTFYNNDYPPAIGFAFGFFFYGRNLFIAHRTPKEPSLA